MPEGRGRFKGGIGPIIGPCSYRKVVHSASLFGVHVAEHFPYRSDTLVVPAFLDTGDNPKALAAWMREHPDSFVAGTFTFERVRQPADPYGLARGGVQLAAGNERYLPLLRRLGESWGRSVAPNKAPLPGAGEGVGGNGRPAPTTADPATPEQQRRLRQEMINKGRLSEKDEREAHHIVPGGGPNSGGRDPRPAQDMLRDAGVSLNNIENGVGLSPDFHRRLHTSEYYRYVGRRLRAAGSPEEIRGFLQSLAKRLEDADRLFRETETMPYWEP